MLRERLVSKTTSTGIKCKSRALKLLPKLAQGPEESARPRLHQSNMQTFGPLSNLAEGADDSKTTFTSLKMQSQELTSSCQNLAERAISQQDHVLQHSNVQIKSIQALSKILLRRERVSKTASTWFKMRLKSSQALFKTLHRDRESADLVSPTNKQNLGLLPKPC